MTNFYTPKFTAKYLAEPKGITIIVGGAGSGKTTLLCESIQRLLEANVFNSYANLVRFEEYKFPELYERKSIDVVLSKNGVVSATTDADVIIVDEIRNPETMLLLDIARKTGKPIFVDIHGRNDFLERLSIIEEYFEERLKEDSFDVRSQLEEMSDINIEDSDELVEYSLLKANEISNAAILEFGTSRTRKVTWHHLS